MKQHVGEKASKVQNFIFNTAMFLELLMAVAQRFMGDVYASMEEIQEFERLLTKEMVNTESIKN